MICVVRSSPLHSHGLEEILLEEMGSCHLQDRELVPAAILEVHARPIRDFESPSGGLPATMLQFPRGRVQVFYLVDQPFARRGHVVGDQKVWLTAQVESRNSRSELLELPDESGVQDLPVELVVSVVVGSADVDIDQPFEYAGVFTNCRRISRTNSRG